MHDNETVASSDSHATAARDGGSTEKYAPYAALTAAYTFILRTTSMTEMIDESDAPRGRRREARVDRTSWVAVAASGEKLARLLTQMTSR